MRITLLIIILLMIIGCKSTKIIDVKHDSNKLIPYVLPIEVESILKKHISEIKNIDNLYFDLKKNDESYIIYVTSSDEIWVRATSRKVLIGNDFYPLLFEMDYIFATNEEIDELIKRIKSKDNYILRKQIYPLYRNIFSVKFTRRGKVLYSGYR